MDREQAWHIVTEFVQSDSLRKHMLSVEFAMRAYAEHYGEDAELVGFGRDAARFRLGNTPDAG